MAGVYHAHTVAVLPPDPNNAGKVQPSWWPEAHKDSAGNSLDAIIGPFTFATLPAAASYSGATARVSDVGRAGGSLWMSDGTIWRPVAPVKIYENTALVSGNTTGNDQVILAMSYAANILIGKVFRVLMSVGKNGTTDAMTTFGLRMGTAGTMADTSLGTVTGITAGQRSLGTELWFRMASATSIEKLGTGNVVGSASWPSGGSTVALLTATTVTTVANAGYIDVTIDMGGTTDTPQVGYCCIEIQP